MQSPLFNEDLDMVLPFRDAAYYGADFLSAPGALTGQPTRAANPSPSYTQGPQSMDTSGVDTGTLSRFSVLNQQRPDARQLPSASNISLSHALSNIGGNKSVAVNNQLFWLQAAAAASSLAQANLATSHGTTDRVQMSNKPSSNRISPTASACGSEGTSSDRRNIQTGTGGFLPATDVQMSVSMPDAAAYTSILGGSCAPPVANDEVQNASQLMGMLLNRNWLTNQQHELLNPNPSTSDTPPGTHDPSTGDHSCRPAVNSSRKGACALSHRLESKRLAQKRYRARQKEKVSSLESRISQINSQLKHLKLENRSLNQRARALSSLITSRDMQLYILNKGKRCFEQQFSSEKKQELAAGNALVSAFYDYIDQYEEKGLHTSVSYDYLRNNWKRVMSNITTYLVQLDLDANNEAVEKSLNEDMHEIGTVVRLLLVQDRQSLFRCFSFNALNGKVQNPEPDHWAKVIEAMGLSPEQRDDFAAAREFHKDSIEKAHAECTALLNCLLDMFESAPNYYSGLSFQRSSRIVDVQCELNLVAQLHEKLENELDVCMMLWLVLSNSLTSIQRARMLVHSHPFFPDLFAMIACV